LGVSLTEFLIVGTTFANPLKIVQLLEKIAGA
jgi:hypothetical protein